MSDTILRHLVAGLATFICAMAYIAGYVSGEHGWWWTIVAVLIVYGAIYKAVDAGGGGHH